MKAVFCSFGLLRFITQLLWLFRPISIIICCLYTFFLPILMCYYIISLAVWGRSLCASKALKWMKLKQNRRAGDGKTHTKRLLLSSVFIIILISLLTLSFSPIWVTPQSMIEISPRVWRKIMILEDITDIECLICSDSVGNRSSEAYFICFVTLVMKWTLAAWKRGRWRGMTRVWGREQPEGFASEGQECFLKPLDYFSSGSEFPSRAVPRFLAESKLIVLWPASVWL